MQSSQQPLGLLPADVVRSIALQDPKAYARLSQLNQRVRSMVQTTLPQVCLAPLTGRELINQMASTHLNVMNGHLKDYNFRSNQRKVDIKVEGEVGNLRLVITEDIDLNQASPILDNYLRQGLKPNLSLVADTYTSRGSCFNLNQRFAQKLLTAEFASRYNLMPRPTADTSPIEIRQFYSDIIDLLDEFEEVLGITDVPFERPQLDDVDFTDPAQISRLNEQIDGLANWYIQLGNT